MDISISEKSPRAAASGEIIAVVSDDPVRSELDRLADTESVVGVVRSREGGEVGVPPYLEIVAGSHPVDHLALQPAVVGAVEEVEHPVLGEPIALVDLGQRSQVELRAEVQPLGPVHASR